MRAFPIILATMIIAAPAVRAQIVADGATNTLSNVTNSFAGDVTVGTNGFFTSLVLTNSALLTNSADGFIGRNTTARSNEVRLLSPGSRWLVGSNLYVGSNAAFSRLVISNGALLGNGLGVIGSGVSSSSNQAVVTGSGSLWSNANDLFVGLNGSGNRLIVSNAGMVVNQIGEVGRNSSRSNVALITGSGSMWSNVSSLIIGRSGSGNELVISNGGKVFNDNAYFSISSSASNNTVIVTGSGSMWSNANNIVVDSGRGNRLIVTNGGMLYCSRTYLGFESNCSNNVAIVTGSGSVWSNASDLEVGYTIGGNQVVVSNGGTAFAGNQVRLGAFPTATNNRIEINGGSLVLSNLFTNASLVVIRGTNVLNAGLIEADRLVLTNALGFFEFNSGTLSCRNSRFSNGTLFRIGNGVSPATFTLAGNGVHDFTGTLAASVSSNATLTGNGMIGGPLVVTSGGRLIPGLSVGKMIVSNSPTLLGRIIMEISKNGATRTNDQIEVLEPLTYGGSLTVSDLGPNALAAGDRFPLFLATSYTGAFSTVTLPPLSVGLAWTNKLAVDGSIEVISTLLPPTTLAIHSSNNMLGLSWPTNTSGYHLETTFDLVPPVLWQPITNGIVISGSSFLFNLTNSTSIPKQFFRLASP